MLYLGFKLDISYPPSHHVDACLQVMERVLAPEIFAMKKRKLESKMKLFQKATFIALNVKRQVGPEWKLA